MPPGPCFARQFNILRGKTKTSVKDVIPFKTKTL